MFSFCIDLSCISNYNEIKDNILNDFEFLKSFYLNNLEILNDSLLNEEERLCFKLNLRHEMEVENNIKDIIQDLKFSGLITDYKSNVIGLPFWIKFDLFYKAKFLQISFYIFWMKKKFNLFEILRESLTNGQIEELRDSILFSICEQFKSIIATPDINILLNCLQLLKEENIIRAGDTIPIDEIIFNKNNSKENLEEDDTNSKEEISKNSLEILKYRTDKLLTKSSITHEKTKIMKINQITQINSNDLSEYEKFFEAGGLVGGIITDRGSTFQTHAIKIYTLSDAKTYMKLLRTNNKIYKATHNINCWRILDKKSKQIDDPNSGLIEGFDDDGEDGAGIRLLGIIQKMKAVNLFVVVSRWFGGINLGNDRFKHINDSAKNLIMSQKQFFDFQN